MSDDRKKLKRMMPNAFPAFFTERMPFQGQMSVMPKILRGESVLFAAPTASGKTEAAVAPLYQRHVTFRRKKLGVVYVAPTKALVNDLHERLTSYLGIAHEGMIARHTGDRHEYKGADGVFCLLATPEALDSLQLRRPDSLASVRAVVVDEIHLLHGQARGQQLRHVIDRMREAATPPCNERDGFQIVGMTATLDDMQRVADIWLGKDAEVVQEGTPREIDLEILDVVEEGDKWSPRARRLASWLKSTRAKKVLIFSNSRNGAHALAACLQSEMKGTPWPVHLHFGALPAGERERVESQMRDDRYGACVATSTLEIGIDIGDVDAVVLAEPPRTVSSFLQRIGRGNRRSRSCRVVGFRGSEEDEQILNALLDCARRGEQDDVFEHDRPSVRFQQILSLTWRATCADRALSVSRLAARAGTDLHGPVVDDMIETECLKNVEGVLIPNDDLMNEGDNGWMHSVIVGGVAGKVIDGRTGLDALYDPEDSSVGGLAFHAGKMRVVEERDDGFFLGDEAKQPSRLAGIRATGPAVPISRSVIRGLARQRGHDPNRWRLGNGGLVTWGGQVLNSVLAAVLSQSFPEVKFTASPEGIAGGGLVLLDISLGGICESARQTQEQDSMPLSSAGVFAGGSRYSRLLSDEMQAVEKRQSVPWSLFFRWLEEVEGIDMIPDPAGHSGSDSEESGDD